MTGQPMTQPQTFLEDVMFDGIVDAIEEMHRETNYTPRDFNRDKVSAMVEWCARSGFLYFDGGCLVLGKIYKPWFSDELCASDIIIYTLKEHRGKGLAKKGISALVQWASENGVKEGNTTIAQSSGMNKESFNAMAESLGMTKMGEVYNV